MFLKLRFVKTYKSMETVNPEQLSILLHLSDDISCQTLFTAEQLTTLASGDNPRAKTPARP